jgi:hypothetical protein
MKISSTLPVFAFFLLLGFDAIAQSSRTTNSVGRRLDDFNRQGDRAARDEMNREMRPRKPTKEQLQNVARVKAETKEDLEGLQDSYNEIVVRLKTRDLPPTFVVEAASKVNKHASRLKLNIAFPKPENESDAKPEDLSRDSHKLLLDLCRRIYDFLTDPMIENPQVLDVEAASKARLSLESVIILSERIART